MKPMEFREKYEKLTPRQKEVLFPFLEGKNDREIAEMLHCTDANVRSHLPKMFRVFDLSSSSGDRCRSELVELFMEHKPELVAESWHKKLGYISRPSDAAATALKPDIPGRPMGLKSDFYIQPSFEERCCEEVLVPGQLIRIRAPQTTGKTSLLYRILDHAREQGYQTVACNLRADLERSDVESLSSFLLWFCRTIAQSLNLPLENLPETISGCKSYLQNQILRKLSEPLVVALDETEVLFEYPEIAKDFFALLRVWHEFAKNPGMETTWEKLRLVIVHSTDDYIHLSRAQSPFENVGYVVRLPQLKAPQIQTLANRYGLRGVTTTEIEQLMTMVGGHPYLIQEALYTLWRKDVTFDELLMTAPTLEGIYRSHLQRLLNLLDEPKLQDALKQVLELGGEVRLSKEPSFKLEGLGLIQFQRNQPQISCELYRRFFQDWL
jgi:DNA-binding CsgD family transcriptional regulator